jgi:hypothetical protein
VVGLPFGKSNACEGIDRQRLRIQADQGGTNTGDCLIQTFTAAEMSHGIAWHQKRCQIAGKSRTVVQHEDDCTGAYRLFIWSTTTRRQAHGEQIKMKNS